MTESAFDTAPEPVSALVAAMEPGAHVMAVRIEPDGSRTVSSYVVGENGERVGEITKVIPATIRQRLERRIRCLLGGHRWETDIEGHRFTCAACPAIHALERDVRA